MIGYMYRAFEYFTKDFTNLKYFSLYNNQFNNDKADPINFPALLIDFIFPGEFEQYSNRIQMLDMTISIYLGTEFYSNLRANEINLDKGLEHLNLISELFSLIEGKSSEDLPAELQSEYFHMGHIHRKTIEILSDYNAIKVTKNTFMFRFTDASAIPLYDEQYVDYELHTNIGHVAEEKVTEIINPNK